MRQTAYFKFIQICQEPNLGDERDTEGRKGGDWPHQYVFTLLASCKKQIKL
jgi:hypothetical protein